MTKTKLIIALSLIGLSFLCCKPATNETETTKAPVAEFDLQWAQRYLDSVNTLVSQQFKAGDSVALAAWYWPDAEILTSDPGPVIGPDKILAFWGASTRMGIPDFTFVTTDIRGNAQYIIETGLYEMKDAKATLVDKGKYVVVHENRNGVWKIIRDIGNSTTMQGSN